MTSFYGGCDPGLNGGWAVISGDKILYKMVMPTLSFKTKDGKTKTEIDREGVLSFLSTIPPLTHVAIEEAQAFRKQNITATCTTCRNYGMLLMALSVAHMNISEVPSDVWQSHFGIVSAKTVGGKTTKAQAFDIAQMIYSDDDFRKSERAHTPHDGIVDAVLIARYCQSLFAPSTELRVEQPEIFFKLPATMLAIERKKKVLLISDWDEWMGAVYECPYCTKESLMTDFKFCPLCGADLHMFRFENREDQEKRIKRAKERTKNEH